MHPVMFADSGLCVPYHQALRGLRLIENGVYEIGHGSRQLKASTILKAQIWYRRFAARMFRWLVIHWLNLPSYLTDTQCGFKIYRGEAARQLYDECFTNGFIFDLEIILRARRHGYRIQEFPIVWTCDPDSRLSLARSPLVIWRELRKLKRILEK
jgi:dolichyl-phosphate beta-glucosyltransferase